jgi:glycosyltransferase involved in cell wall biosynthesis
MSPNFSRENEAKRPLITFAVFAFNQQAFVKEAVESALAQTYSPLEIIVLDDDSSDRTFECCEKLVAAYSGPHDVKVNRNQSNIGLVPSVNRVFNMASGELVVMAAGDDISYPERTTRTVAEWLKSGRPAGIASAARLVDAAGKALGVVDPCPYLKGVATKDAQMAAFAGEPLLSLLGCTAAWSRSTWDIFGPLPADCRNEDNVLTLRSILLGGAGFIDEQLVDYRLHGTNVWNSMAGALPISFADISANERAVQRKANMHRQSLTGSLQDLDVALARGLLSQLEYNKLAGSCAAAIKRLELRERWWELGFGARRRGVAHLREDVRTRYSMLLPQKIHFRVTALRHRFKRARAGSGDQHDPSYG